MPRIARVVVPNIPHHVVQRGNRRQRVFFRPEDRAFYLALLGEQSRRAGLSIWAYCLMDNHVHLVAVPSSEKSLASAIGETHRRYTRAVNLREGWRGYLWQGRFSSYPLDHSYLYSAVRYVERNPVKAGMADKAEDYPWSSARAHVLKTKDPLLSENFLSHEINDWSQFLEDIDTAETFSKFELHLNTGRPLGPAYFVESVAKSIGRSLAKKKPGPKPTGEVGTQYLIHDGIPN